MHLLCLQTNYRLLPALLVFTALSLFADSSIAADIINHSGAAGIPSQYIVVFKKDIDTDKTADRFIKRFSKMKVLSRYRHALNGMAVRLSAQQIKKLALDPDIAYIEQDIRFSANAQILPTGVNRINADTDPVANIDGVDDRVDVDIAILDTGIDLDHPDLNVFRYAYCFTPGNTKCSEGDARANDVHGHGTHVAGIAAALDNTSGVVGVAPGARLWAIKVLDDNGYSDGSEVLDGVEYVAQHADEIEVANMSLSGDSPFTSLETAIQSAIDAGVVFTLAAGNKNRDVSLASPAGQPNSITVSALTDYDGMAGGLSGNSSDDTFAYYSNYGSGVDIMAPGTSIRSTIPGGGTGVKSGTSMAAPHIAGAAALYMSQHPGASPATVKAALLSTVDPAPCVNHPDGTCGQPHDPDGIQEPLILLSCYDEDADDICADIDPDDDNDGLSDVFEDSIGTSSLLVDTDGDGLSDYVEVAYDGDDSNYDPDFDLNPLSVDSDSDGVEDAVDVEPLTVNLGGDVAPADAPDGVINAADLLIQTRIVQGELSPDALLLQNGDLYPTGSPDGVIDLSDLILLQQMVLSQ